MKLLEKIELSKSKEGGYYCKFNGNWTKVPDSVESFAADVYHMWKRKYVSNDCKLNALDKFIAIFKQELGIALENDDDATIVANEIDKVKTVENLQKLIDFFKEFAFTPNFRFVNTFVRKCYYKDSPKTYVKNYFALTDNAYCQSIQEKMRSQEFNELIDSFAQKCKPAINTRFRLYYGSQGTGKTTQAMLEASNNVMVCHSAMLPSDLMEDFKFDDGKAAFTPSALCKAMTEGKTIVLDEINLLPFESLRFLQSILDNKSQFEYKGQTINIKDGFKIIGTMNLQVNGMTYALPEPLVDRAEDLKCFELTADQLLSAII